MNKKLGISIIIGVVILSVIIGIVSIVYVSLNDIYAADTLDGFSFAIVNGKPKEYVGENAFLLTEGYIFNLELPKGVNKSSVKFSEKDGLLDINDQVVTAVKMGKGTLKATVKVKGKEYETTTKFEVIDNDFRFELDGKSQKEYTGSNAFVVGEEIDFSNMKIPSGYTAKDVVLTVKGNVNADILEINGLKATPKKAGKGELYAVVGTKSDAPSVTTKFEVVKAESSKNNNSKDKNTNTSTNTSTSKNKATKDVTLSFKNDEASAIYAKGGILTSSLSKTGVLLKNITWTSSDTSVATIKDSAGRLDLVGIGKTTITATHADSGTSASYTLTVHQKKLDIIDKSNSKNITGNKIAIKINDTKPLSLQDAKGQIDSSNIKWVSSREKVCTVDSKGNIKGISKGTATIKGVNIKNNKSYGQITVEVADTAEQVQTTQMLAGKFSFAEDAKTGKAKEYKGENSLVIGNEYRFELIRPEGTEEYPIQYSTSNSKLVDIQGETIIPRKIGSGTLTAKIKIGTKYKTATAKFTVVATAEEKESAKGTDGKYAHIAFQEDKFTIEKGKTISLKPFIETNLGNKDYTVEWTASPADSVEFSSSLSNAKTNKITPKKVGPVDIEVKIKSDKINTSAKVTLDVQEKVIDVKTVKILNINTTKKGTAYQLTTDQVYIPQVTILPENANERDYRLEVKDNDNFIVMGKSVIAVNPGYKTTLTAYSTGSNGKASASVTIQSVGTAEDIEALPNIAEDKTVTVKLGETVQFKKASNLAKYTNRNTRIVGVEYDEEILKITGKKIGESIVLAKYNDKQEEIKVKVVENTDVLNEEDTVMPTLIKFAKDVNTGKNKNYVNDYPFEVGKYYTVDVDFAPSNATYKEVDFSVNNDSFTVTPENKIVANEANKTATLTATLKSDPKVSASIKIASTEETISKIAFARDGYTLDIKDHNSYNFNLVITLSNGTVYDPLTKDLSNNTEYQNLLKKITIYTDEDEYLDIRNNEAFIVKGVNGSGTLRAVLNSNKNVTAKTDFSTIGVVGDVTIRSAKFARKTYSLTEDGEMGFLPIITLSTGEVLDPSDDYDDPKGIATTAEYKNYLSQLELANVDSDSSSILSTDRLVALKNKPFVIDVRYEGTCKLGIKFKDSDEVIATTKLNIKFTEADTSDEKETEAIVDPIDHSTTTTDKSLKITKAKFAQDSYELTGNYAYAFNPVITLSDGTKMSHESKDKDVYEYYCNTLELYFTNEGASTEIDLGVLTINNNKVPREATPIKNGKVILAIGRKSDSTTLGTVPVTVKIK